MVANDMNEMRSSSVRHVTVTHNPAARCVPRKLRSRHVEPDPTPTDAGA